MRLADVVATAVPDKAAPAAALAIAYAERIDESGHTGLALAVALDQLRLAAELADKTYEDDANMRAFRKVGAALSAVTVIAELGPKLLATLDALVLTPKARAEVSKVLTPPTPASSPIAALRAEEDELASRRARRSG